RAFSPLRSLDRSKCWFRLADCSRNSLPSVLDLGLAAPDLGQRAFAVAAKNFFNVGVGIFPADQPLGQVKDALRMVQPFDKKLVAKSIAGLVVRLLFLPLFKRDGIVRLESAVVSYAHIFHSYKTRYVVKMIENILNGGWFRVLDERPEAGDAHDAPGF